MMEHRLTAGTVRFLLLALLDGTITRSTACALVTPWVEGTRPSEPLAEDGAQLLHGSDIVRASDGQERHQSQGGQGDLVTADSELSDRLRAWLSRNPE